MDITIRVSRILNGFVVHADTGLLGLNMAGNNGSNAQFFATEEDLQAALGGLALQHLEEAREAHRQQVERARQYQGMAQSLHSTGGIQSCQAQNAYAKGY